MSASPDAPTRPPAFEAFRVLFDAGDLAGAERLGADLLTGPPGRAIDVLVRLALLRRRARNPGHAIAALSHARSLAAAATQPLPDWFLGELAGCHAERQEWPQALEAAQQGLAAKPVLGLTAVTALAHLGRVEAARTRLRQTAHLLGSDPSRAAALAAACRALLAADPSDAARAVVTEAAGLHGQHAAFADIRASLAFLAGDHDAAQALFAALPAPALQRLQILLRQDRAHAARYLHLFEAALLATPDNEAALSQWRDLLPPAEAPQRLEALQDAAAHILPAALPTLARQLKLPELHRRYAVQIATWQDSATVADCESCLDALSRFQPPDPAALARLLAMPISRLRAFFLLRRPRLRAIRVREPSPAEAGLLRDAGIDIAATAAFLQDMVTHLSPEWAAYLDQAEFASPDAERMVRLDESFAAFQDRILRDRDFPMIDPEGGAATLFDSVKIHDRQVFAFRGRELLAFHTAGNMNFAVGLHLVRQNILLLVDTAAAPSKQSFYAADVYMAEVMAVWLRRVASHWQAYLDAAAAPAPATRRIAVIHGRAENPAHHVWNYLPPFERLALAGLLGHVDTLVVPPTRYFGPVEALYPELAAAERREMTEAAAIDPCPFDPGAIALQLGASVVPRPTMQRIRAWAERTAAPAARARIAEAAARHPVIWVGLRVGDKMWVGQTPGIARMIDLIVPLWPDALFVLDGFSLPDDTDKVVAKWQSAVQALTQVASDIATATRHPGAVLSLVGNRLSESVLWAQAAHAYFTPLGSSQHKIGWYSDAPGLVYTSANLTKAPPQRRQGSWEAEGSKVPHFLIGEVADAGNRRGDHDFRTNLHNLDFPPELAARRLLAILEAAEEARSTVQTKATRPHPVN